MDILQPSTTSVLPCPIWIMTSLNMKASKFSNWIFTCKASGNTAFYLYTGVIYRARHHDIIPQVQDGISLNKAAVAGTIIKLLLWTMSIIAASSSSCHKSLSSANWTWFRSRKSFVCTVMDFNTNFSPGHWTKSEHS